MDVLQREKSSKDTTDVGQRDVPILVVDGQEMVLAEHYFELLRKYKCLQRKTRGKSSRKKLDKQDAEELLAKQKERKKIIRTMKLQKSEKKQQAQLDLLTDNDQIHRLKIIHEIMQTEASYRENLTVLIYCRNVLVADKVLKAQDAELMFSNLEKIHYIHQDIASTLEGRMLATKNENAWCISLGDIFLKLAENLGDYTSYVNHQNIRSGLIDLYSSKKQFQSSLYVGVPEFIDLSLVTVHFHSLIITPIQRICKYPLLLRELISKTEDTHPDKLVLVEALARIQDETMKINEMKKIYEQHIKKLEVCNTIEIASGEEIDLASRTLLQEGEVLQIRNGKESLQSKLFLFHDKLLFGKAKKEQKIRVQIFALDKLLVVSQLVTQEYDPHDLSFEIVCVVSKQRFCFQASSTKERDWWLHAIEERVNYYLGMLNQLSRNSQKMNKEIQTLLESEDEGVDDYAKAIENLVLKIEFLKDEGEDLEGELFAVHMRMIRLFEVELESLQRKAVENIEDGRARAISCRDS